MMIILLIMIFNLSAKMDTVELAKESAKFVIVIGALCAFTLSLGFTAKSKAVYAEAEKALSERRALRVVGITVQSVVFLWLVLLIVLVIVFIGRRVAT